MPRLAPIARSEANSRLRAFIISVNSNTVISMPSSQKATINAAMVPEIWFRLSAMPETMLVAVATLTPSTLSRIASATASLSYPGATRIITEETIASASSFSYLNMPFSRHACISALQVSKFM